LKREEGYELREINLKQLKTAIDDLGIEHVAINPEDDFYWDCSFPDVYDSRRPATLGVGRLSDDFEFSGLIQRSDSGAVSYNLVYLAPLLRDIAEKVKD
jgi:hypothetical protein